MQLKIRISSPNAEWQELTLVSIPTNGHMIDELVSVVKQMSKHSPDVRVQVMYLDHDEGIAQLFYRSDNWRKR